MRPVRLRIYRFIVLGWNVSDSLERSVIELRKWQCHWLLRQFGENGCVLPENLELSKHIDVVIAAAEPQPSKSDRK